MSPKASEPHSSKLHSCGTEPSQGPSQPPCWGGPKQILNHTEFISEFGAVMCRFPPPLRHSSICGFHLCRLSNLSDIYWLHPRALRFIRSYQAHKGARQRGKGLIVNMIIPSDAVIRFKWVTHTHARTEISEICFSWKGQKTVPSSFWSLLLLLFSCWF